jgi:hypothetical protein
MVALSGTNLVETTRAAEISGTKTLVSSYCNEAAVFLR